MPFGKVVHNNPHQTRRWLCARQQNWQADRGQLRRPPLRQARALNGSRSNRMPG